jgi:hypothetical protein
VAKYYLQPKISTPILLWENCVIEDKNITRYETIKNKTKAVPKIEKY